MTLRTSTIDGTFVVKIDRPPVNALDIETIAALEQTFDGVVRAAPRGGVVLTGAGKAFSAGVDTRAFASYDRERRREMVRGITRMVARLLAIPVPVVAAVNGHALGGGFVLMLACDYRIASDIDAKFGLTEGQAGVPFPAGPLEIIRHELAPGLLRRLTLTSEVLDGHGLLDAGTIDALSPADTIEAAALARAAALAAQPAFRTVKRQIRGALADRVAALASSGEDPLLEAF